METVNTTSGIQFVSDLLRRHVWLIASIFLLILTTLLAFVVALPDVYVSTASIAVQGQQVSTNIVQPRETLGTEGKIRLLSQKILSRPRLSQLAEQFGLYQELRQERQGGQMIAAAMRRDVGLEVRSDGNSQEDTTVTFDISYRGTEPQKVQKVAESLAFFYMDENKKDTKELADGTTTFLRTQLKETEQKLEGQERQVAEYKQRHIEELPENLATNLATLSQLKSQVDALAVAIGNGQERREALSRRLALMNPKPIEGATFGTPGGVAGTSGGGSPTGKNADGRLENDVGLGLSLLGELETLKGRLAQLLIRFSEKHPDVLQLKKEIAALEQKIAALPADVKSQLSGRTPLSGGFSAPAPMSPSQVVSAATESAQRITQLTNLQSEHAALEVEISRKSAELTRLRKEVAVYQTRLENAPKRNQELQTLSRDYASTHELYLSLLKRLDEALLAGNLDQTGQGAHFTLVEPALYPQDPVGPRRRLLSFAAIFVSLGFAIVVVLLREVLNPVFHRIEELRDFTTVEILGTVPRIATETEWAKQRLRRCVNGIAVLLVSCGLGMASHSLGKGHTQIAKALSRSSGKVELR